ncbi:MAG TPA: alpha/beta hydrolase, partial [Longimicrobiaceae bacterium]|nr:alpha/beta hydrolase [Longimicrobiaceae bacterium]
LPARRPGGRVTPADRAAARFPQCAARWSVTSRIDVDGVAVRFREAGEGPPVVLAHGLGMSADYWWRNGPALAAAGYRVLAPDFPGFGRTAERDGEGDGLTVPEQAHFLARFTARLRTGPAVFVGHSLAAQSVLELGAHLPRACRGVVAVAPTGDRRRGRMLRELGGFLSDALVEPLSLFPIVADAYLRSSVRHYWGTWRAGSHSDAFAAAHRTPCPALVVVGSNDPIVPVPFAAALADALPRGRLVVVPGGSHAVIYDRARHFNRVLLAFFAQLPGPE